MFGLRYLFDIVLKFWFINRVIMNLNFISSIINNKIKYRDFMPNNFSFKIVS